MSKKDQAISKIEQTMEISFEIMELDDLALGEVIGGLLDVNNCTNGSGCTTNDSCGGGGGGGGGTNQSCNPY